MGGKSTYLRQVALLALLAQAGSFVPARTREARARRSHLRARRRLGQHRARPVDVHGRDAGDGDHPAHGDRSRSLVILDEIGRGTATFDGLSLAWAVAEHLASNAARAPEDDLRDALPRAHRPGRRAAGVVNFHVAAREFRDEIVFLHKIVAGPIGQELRHPGGAARRPAGGGRPARRRDSQVARAGRAAARRAARA